MHSCLQSRTNVLNAVSLLLCLQELLALVFIGLQALFMGKMIFFGFLQVRNGNLRRPAAVKGGFLPVLPIILASRPIDMCASSS